MYAGVMAPRASTLLLILFSPLLASISERILLASTSIAHPPALSEDIAHIVDTSTVAWPQAIVGAF